MLGFEALSDAEKIEKMAGEFGKLIEYCFINWDEWYNRHIDEVKAGLPLVASIDDNFSDTDLHAALRRPMDRFRHRQGAAQWRQGPFSRILWGHSS